MEMFSNISVKSCNNSGKERPDEANRKWEIDERKKNSPDKSINKHLYEITENDSKMVIQLIINELSDIIMANDEIKLLYGTRSLILLSKFLPEKWQNLVSRLVSTDIDIAVNDPAKLGNQMFDYLVNMALTKKFVINKQEIFITKIYLSQKHSDSCTINLNKNTDGKCPDLYTLSVEVRVKINGEYFLGRYIPIIDISSLSKWTENAIYKINDKLFVQHPLHYICGLIDKLFNSRLNPRIEEKNRESSVLSTKNKLSNLCIHSLSNEDKELALVLVQDNSELLSSFKNDVSKVYALNTLHSVLADNLNLSIFDKWNNIYPLIIDKLVITLSKIIDKPPEIICSLSFMDLLNDLLEKFVTLDKFLKYIKTMRGYRNSSYVTDNFIVIKFRYVDGFPIAWINSSFYMRGSIVAIDKNTKEFIILKIGPTKGFETGYKAYTGETQDIKKHCAPLTFEQLTLRETLIENSDTPLYGELTMKVDGSLLSILRIPKNSIQYTVFSEILNRYSVNEMEKEYIQFLLNIDNNYLYVPVSQNTDLVRVTEGFFPTMVTAICGPLGKIMWDKPFDGSELEKLVYLFQLNFPAFIEKIKEIDVPDTYLITSYYFEAVCANQTTLNDKKIPDLALSYDKSNLYFLGLRQFNNTTIGPYLSSSKFTHTFLIPMYWKIRTPIKINQISDALSLVLSGSKTEKEFLNEFPHKGSDEIHFEGFVFLVDNINGMEFPDPLYAKLKSPFWYELHKTGKDIIEIINKINPKYCELFPIIGLIQRITPELVEQLLEQFQQIVKNNIQIYFDEMTESSMQNWGVSLTYSQFKKMKRRIQEEKILIFSDVIAKSVNEVFGNQFSRFTKTLQNENDNNYISNMKFFRAFLNPYSTKSKQEFINELVELLKKHT